jgi:hypothetical protein
MGFGEKYKLLTISYWEHVAQMLLQYVREYQSYYCLIVRYTFGSYSRTELIMSGRGRFKNTELRIFTYSQMDTH